MSRIRTDNISRHEHRKGRFSALVGAMNAKHVTEGVGQITAIAATSASSAMDSAHRNKQLKAELQKELLVRLDACLPPGLKRTAQRNGAGKRSVGLAGRSSNDILHDCAQAVRALQSADGSASGQKRQRAGPDQEPPSRKVPRATPRLNSTAPPFRDMLLGAHGVFCIEVRKRGDSGDWIVAHVGRGAQSLVLKNPSAQCGIEGNFLRNIIHPDDYDSLLQFDEQGCLLPSSLPKSSTVKVRLMCFGGAPGTKGKGPKFVSLDLQVLHLSCVEAAAADVGGSPDESTPPNDRVPSHSIALLLGEMPTCHGGATKVPAAKSPNVSEKERWNPAAVEHHLPLQILAELASKQSKDAFSAGLLHAITCEGAAKLPPLSTPCGASAVERPGADYNAPLLGSDHNALLLGILALARSVPLASVSQHQSPYDHILGLDLGRAQHALSAPASGGAGGAGLRADEVVLPPMLAADAVPRLPPIKDSTAAQSVPAFHWA